MCPRNAFTLRDGHVYLLLPLKSVAKLELSFRYVLFLITSSYLVYFSKSVAAYMAQRDMLHYVQLHLIKVLVWK